MSSVSFRFPLPEREIKRNRGDATAPYRTPVLLGATIAIDREFFFEIGAFDKELQFYGGDNTDLSLRVSFPVFFPFIIRTNCRMKITSGLDVWRSD